MIAKFAQRKLTAAGQKAAVIVAVSASALTGAGFLTAAGWTALSDHYGSAAASATVGGCLLTPLAGLGLAQVFRRVKEPEPIVPAAVTFAQVMLAFTLATRLGETLIRSRGNREPGP
jgi:hypothetical protein